jgi:hypothetical protein
MRLSELLASVVEDEHGTHLGHVHDVRLVQDGPIGSGFEAAFRVHGLIVGRGAIANRLGYGRTGSRSPWLIRVFARSGKDPKFVAWQRVRSIEPKRVIITGRAEDVPDAESLPALRGTTSA